MPPRPAADAFEEVTPEVEAALWAERQPGSPPREITDVWALILAVRCFFRMFAVSLWVSADTALHHAVRVPLRAASWALAGFRPGGGDAAAVAFALAAAVAAIGALDSAWIEAEVLSQRRVKLYWIAQVALSVDRVLAGWFGPLLGFVRRSRGAAELCASLAVLAASTVLHAVVVEVVVYVVAASYRGGGAGMGYDVHGGAAVLALFTPVCLVSALRVPFAGHSRGGLVRGLVEESSRVAQFAAVFALASWVRASSGDAVERPVLGGAAFFLVADVSIQALRHVTTVRESRLPAHAAALAEWQAASAYTLGRRRLLYGAAGSSSVALVAVAARVAAVSLRPRELGAVGLALVAATLVSGAALRRYMAVRAAATVAAPPAGEKKRE